MQQELTYDFNCYWTNSKWFVYEPEKRKEDKYTRKYYADTPNRIKILDGVWCCKISSHIEELEVEQAGPFIEVSFAFVLDVPFVRGNPENIKIPHYGLY